MSAKVLYLRVRWRAKAGADPACENASMDLSHREREGEALDTAPGEFPMTRADRWSRETKIMEPRRAKEPSSPGEVPPGRCRDVENDQRPCQIAVGDKTTICRQLGGEGPHQGTAAEVPYRESSHAKSGTARDLAGGDPDTATGCTSDTWEQRGRRVGPPDGEARRETRPTRGQEVRGEQLEASKADRKTLEGR